MPYRARRPPTPTHLERERVYRLSADPPRVAQRLDTHLPNSITDGPWELERRVCEACATVSRHPAWADPDRTGYCTACDRFTIKRPLVTDDEGWAGADT